jgi:dCTP deaminase
MGRQYYLSAGGAEAATNKLQKLSAGDSLAIPSGQFAVLLTEEIVTVPPGAMAFISIKNGFKSRGLVNVSGFHVDPGFSAPLKFAVFNAGPSTIVIRQGDDCFLIWFADLDREDREHVKSDGQNRKYSRGIIGDDVASLGGSVETIDVLAKKVRDLERTQFGLKILLGFFAILGTTIVALMLFLAQEGVRSMAREAGSALLSHAAGPLNSMTKTGETTP